MFILIPYDLAFDVKHSDIAFIVYSTIRHSFSRSTIIDLTKALGDKNKY